LDNDEAGIRAMRNYRDKYQLEPIYFMVREDLKDIADSVHLTKGVGPKKVKARLIPLIDKKLNKVV
jgi:hypothetical protein